MRVPLGIIRGGRLTVGSDYLSTSITYLMRRQHVGERSTPAAQPAYRQRQIEQSQRKRPRQMVAGSTQLALIKRCLFFTKLNYRYPAERRRSLARI